MSSLNLVALAVALTIVVATMAALVLKSIFAARRERAVSILRSAYDKSSVTGFVVIPKKTMRTVIDLLDS